MRIRLLSPNLINQIAAGEVIERPASALKELIENAIDAGADKIDVTVNNGGKTYFSVTDNGRGMTQDELALSIQRHATSKLPDDNLSHITTLGFRGEALPSIGSVARLKISSRPAGATTAFQIRVEGGSVFAPEPTAHNNGTTVEVRDLFYATPARLKFLKADATELGYMKDVINRMAMAYPHIAFSLTSNDKKIISLPATDTLLNRLDAVMGKGFKENVLPVQTVFDEITLSGFVGVPTYTRATAGAQYLFVNGRFIRDKMLAGAIRGAFQGLVGHDVFPVAVLFLTLDPEVLDVNVHPAKTEVRFKDAQRVRGVLVSSLRTALAQGGNRTSSQIAVGALEHAVTDDIPHITAAYPTPHNRPTYACYEQSPVQNSMPFDTPFSVRTEQHPVTDTTNTPAEQPATLPPLGLAKAQVHATYIIAQAQDGIVVVDQHAAHERLTYEKLMNAYQTGGIQTQLLLIPVIIDLTPDETQTLTERAAELKAFGLQLEAFGPDSVAVREIPALLDKTDLKRLIQDLADTCSEWRDTVLLADRVKDVCARMACHGSVRAGRVLTAAEMDALLRQMEACGTSGQCIHGRPTYIKLKLTDIERLFGRRS